MSASNSLSVTYLCLKNSPDWPVVGAVQFLCAFRVAAYASRCYLSPLLILSRLLPTLVDALFPSHIDRSHVGTRLFFFVCLFSVKPQSLFLVSRIVPKAIPLILRVVRLFLTAITRQTQASQHQQN